MNFMCLTHATCQKWHSDKWIQCTLFKWIIFVYFYICFECFACNAMNGFVEKLIVCHNLIALLLFFLYFYYWWWQEKAMQRRRRKKHTMMIESVKPHTLFALAKSISQCSRFKYFSPKKKDIIKKYLCVKRTREEVKIK